MEFKYDGGGLAKGGGVTLYIDGKKAGEGRVERTEPFMFSADEYIGIRPSIDFTFMIINSPVGPYYSTPVKVKIETKYTRAIAGGT